MGFDESGHPAGCGKFAEGAEFGFVEDGDDQEDSVGSRRGRFADVVFGDREILPNDGQGGGGAGGAEVGEAALEEVVVGEDGEGYCPALLVFQSEVGGTK